MNNETKEAFDEYKNIKIQIHTDKWFKNHSSLDKQVWFPKYVPKRVT